jgi:hypothetical protein
VKLAVLVGSRFVTVGEMPRNDHRSDPCFVKARDSQCGHIVAGSDRFDPIEQGLFLCPG